MHLVCHWHATLRRTGILGNDWAAELVISLVLKAFRVTEPIEMQVETRDP